MLVILLNLYLFYDIKYNQHKVHFSILLGTEKDVFITYISQKNAGN